MSGGGGLQRVTDAGAQPASIVIACALTLSQRARLHEAVRGRADVRSVDSFDQLTRALRGTVESIDLVVLPARDATGADAARVIREISKERPRMAIVAYCQAGSQYSTDIRALAAAGVDQFVFAGIDDNGVAFRTVLDAARRQCAGEWVMQQLAPIIPSALHPMVEAMLARPDEVTTLKALADATGLHRKTLFNRCDTAGFLPPAELLTWVRLALVAYHLENTGCTIETIANELAFPSDNALRNIMKRYTGMRAGQVRQQGGVQAVIQALSQRLRPLPSAPSAENSGRGLHLL